MVKITPFVILIIGDPDFLAWFVLCSFQRQTNSQHVECVVSMRKIDRGKNMSPRENRKDHILYYSTALVLQIEIYFK